MQDHIELSLLLDYYGEFLTDRQRELMQLSVQEDLSLSEIAEIVGISRQGVRDAVKRGEEQMRQMEERLKLISRAQRIGEGLKKLSADIMKLEIPEAEKARLTKDLSAVIAAAEE